MTTIIAISDTHCQMDKISLPKGDLLIHAGDLTYRGTVSEMAKELKALAQKAKDFKKIIYLSGNHDWLAQLNPELTRQMCRDNGIDYICEETIEFDGLKIFGSPWQPEFYDWAFNLPRGPKLEQKWAMIPDDTDVLITHGPAYGALDQCDDGRRVGCMHLMARVLKLKNLKYHIFGHIHYSHGKKFIDPTHFRNVAICDEQYVPINPPTVIKI